MLMRLGYSSALRPGRTTRKRRAKRLVQTTARLTTGLSNLALVSAVQECSRAESRLQICSLNGKDAESCWDRFVVENPKGTFFHQTAWKRVIEKTYGYEPFY